MRDLNEFGTEHVGRSDGSEKICCYIRRWMVATGREIGRDTTCDEVMMKASLKKL